MPRHSAIESALPKAILLDLDDTILDDSGTVDACWREACEAGASECGMAPEELRETIRRISSWFWSYRERHRTGRLDLRAARIEVARRALAEHGVETAELAETVGGTYHALREDRIEIFPDAIDTLERLRRAECRLALLTNGNKAPQRRKIEKFGLNRFFEAIFIEGELGFGKPDERIYSMALDALHVEPCEAWMAGDNLEWDVAQPQKLGIFAVWIDAQSRESSRLGTIRPDRIIRRLSELPDSFNPSTPIRSRTIA